MADDSGANPQLPSPVKPDAPAPAVAATAPQAAAETTSAEAVEALSPVNNDPLKEAEDPSKSSGDKADVNMAEPSGDATAASDSPPSGVVAEPASALVDAASPPAAAEGAAVATPGSSKPKGTPKAHRKSIGGGKKLNRKASKAKIRHTDAKPGDHFLLKLKGHPEWPVIIADEEMLSTPMINTRPVGAARVDGTYRDDFADGGKKAGDRSFAVMFLHTNEFTWTVNTALREFDPETVMESVNEKTKSDVKAAFVLASESNPLSYYKDELERWQREKEELAQAQLAEIAAAPKKSKKGKTVSADEDEDDEDVDMADVGDEEVPAVKKTKKRKADEDTAAPQRSDSVKKPKIKITSSSTPRPSNGVPTPKSAKSTEPKAAKSKSKKEGKTGGDKKADKEAQVPKEPELSPAEKHQRKEKEVLFLRHKLQKGLLTRDQEPKVEEMETMSDYITKLEHCPDLEVSIIRATKINKVLKAILKLESIPKEDEFRFKTRSQDLLEKWNKLLAAADLPVAPVANGVNGTTGEAAPAKEPEAASASKAETTNGTSENTEETQAGDAVTSKAVQPLAAQEAEKGEKIVVEEPVKDPESGEVKLAESAV